MDSYSQAQAALEVLRAAAEVFRKATEQFVTVFDPKSVGLQELCADMDEAMLEIDDEMVFAFEDFQP
jgi:hypothetical protein